MTTLKKLYLSDDDVKLTGLCGGLGEYFGVDPTIIRLVVIGVTITTAILPGSLAYIIASLIVPKKDTPHAKA